MSNELKPCPFCGVPENRDTTNFDHHKDGCYLKLIELNIHIAYKNSIYGTNFNRIPEACVLEAWNTRAERTCHDVEADDEQFFRCSQCGCEVMLHVEVHTSTWNALWAGELNYCPNCGAKVVE